MDDELRKLGTILKSARVNAGYGTQQSLADALAGEFPDERGLSRGTIAAVEAGRQRPTETFLARFRALIPESEELVAQAIDRASKQGTDLEQSGVIEAFLAEIRRLERRSNWIAILRYRDTFSRFLYLEARHDARLYLGTCAQRGSVELGDHWHLAAALVDDIGWSHVCMNRISEARDAISHGIDVADLYELAEWQAKGHRHLAAIGMHESEYEVAHAQLDLALKACDGIQNPTTAAELQAGVEYGRAQALYEQDEPDLKEAQLALSNSANIRRSAGISDQSRDVRIDSLLGKIFERQEKFNLAGDAYERGLSKSEQIGRIDEQLQNLDGLARVRAFQGKVSLAESYQSRANAIRHRLGIQ